MMVTSQVAIDLETERTVQRVARLHLPKIPSRLFPKLEVISVILCQRTISTVAHLLHSALHSITLDFHPPYPSLREIETHFGSFQQMTCLRSLCIELAENPDPTGLAPWAERLFTYIPDRSRIEYVTLTGCATSRDIWSFAASCAKLVHLSLGPPAFLELTCSLGLDVLLKQASGQRIDTLDVEAPNSTHPFDMESLLHFPRLAFLSLRVGGVERPKNLEVIAQLHRIRYLHLQMPHLHYELDHDKLVKLATAWPKLRVLSITEPTSGESAAILPPALHISSLEVLAKHCRKLERLEIVVNTTTSAEIRPLPTAKFDNDFVLDLTGSNLDMASRDHVMLFLFYLCPKLQNLVVGHPIEVWRKAADIWDQVSVEAGRE